MNSGVIIWPGAVPVSTAGSADEWPTVRALVASGDRSLVPPVQAALERYLDEHDWYGRDLMAFLVAGPARRWPTPCWHYSPIRRRWSAPPRRGLGQLGGSLDALQSSAADPDPQVRAAISAALARQAAPHLAATLQDLATDASAAVRAAVATALRDSTWPGVHPLRATLAQDPDRAVRARADVALASIRTAATG